MARIFSGPEDSSPIVIGDSGSNPVRSLKRQSRKAEYISIDHRKFHMTPTGLVVKHAGSSHHVEHQGQPIPLDTPWTLYLNGGAWRGGLELHSDDNKTISIWIWYVGSILKPGEFDLVADDHPKLTTKLRVGKSKIVTAELETNGVMHTLNHGGKPINIAWR